MKPLLKALLLPAALLGAVAQGSILTVSNHADTPVYATAVTVPAADLYAGSGIAEGTPVAITLPSGGRVPTFPGNDNGTPVVRAFLSLQAGEALPLTINPAAGWDSPASVCSATYNALNGTAQIANGVVKLDYTGGRWSLAFAGPMADTIAPAASRVLFNNCRLDAWLDTEDRGRLYGVDPVPLGLVHVDDAVLVDGHAQVNADGSASLTLVKGFSGAYSDVVLTETFTLLPGKPVVEYRSNFHNNGTSPRYVAYVELGGGVRGSFTNLMTVEPVIKYEDPDEPSMILLSGTSNGFTRVAWRRDKCWLGVESGSGAGVGFSTLDSITVPLLGSTVWSVTPSGFLICLIDAAQGNFPLLINPGESVETGLAFVANAGGTDMWTQSDQLFHGVTTGQVPAMNDSHAAYLDGEAVLAAQVESFTDISEMIAGANGRSAALDIDFRIPYDLKVQVDAASAGSPVVVRARSMEDPAEVHDVLTASAPGQFVVDFTAQTGWLKQRKRFILELAEAAGSAAGAIELSRAPLPAPVLNSPADGASITDIAANFRWSGVPGAIDYELQLATDIGFTAPDTIAVRSEIEWPFFLPDDSQLPAPGTWYWRVRAVAGGIPGEWSAPFRMEVNADHSTMPLLHTFTPERPLFTFEGFQVTDWSRFADTIPADIRPFAAFNCALKFDLIDVLRPLYETDQRVFLRTHHPSPITGWTPLAEVEAVFQAYPNVIGSMGGESLTHLFGGGLNQMYTMRLLQLCAKYGRIYYEADGTYSTNKWEELYAKNGPFVLQYADYLVFAQKNNILNRQFVSQSSALGLYLAGDIYHQGSWEDGGWYWQQVGFQELGEMFGRRGGDVTKMPRNFWNLTFLMGVARGCSIFSLDGQAGVARVGEDYSVAESGLPATASRAAYMTNQGELTPVFHRYIAPFIRGVINNNMVPTKAQVLEQVRLGVYNDGVPEGSDPDPYYFQYKALYEGTYGFRDIGLYPGTLMEFFPNTGRYYYFPLFPQGAVSLGNGIETVPLSQLLDPVAVRARFDAAYPQFYDGATLVNLVGDTLAVMNSNENLDETESYLLPLTNRGLFTAIAGTIEPHAYLMGKFKERNRRLWLQANAEYPERDTQIVISCTREPLAIVSPANALVSSSWNAATGDLQLTLSHADGAVEVLLSHPVTEWTAEEWLAEYASTIASPADGGGGPFLWYADFSTATVNGHMDNSGSAGATPSTHQAYRLGAQSHADSFGNAAMAFGLADDPSQSAAVAGSTGLFMTGPQGTVSLLFKTPPELSGLKVLFQQGNGFELALDGPSVRLAYTNGGTQYATLGGALDPETWYYAALRWDTTKPSGDLTWYLGAAGGEALQSGSLTIDAAGGNAAITIAGRASANFFTGPMQQFAVWERELSDTSIRAMHGTTVIQVPEVLVDVSLEMSTDQQNWQPADPGLYEIQGDMPTFRVILTPKVQP